MKKRLQENVICGRLGGISCILRLHAVECVYFRINLNTLGHGLGWDRKPKQHAPREWWELMDGAGICHASHWAVFQGRVHRQKWAWCLEGPSVLLGTVIRRQISRRARLAQCYLGADIWPLYQIVLSVFQLGPCTQVHRRTFKVHPGYITLWKLASRSSTSVCPPYDYTTCLSECSWGQLWAISPFPAPFLIALLPPYKKKKLPHSQSYNDATSQGVWGNM